MVSAFFPFGFGNTCPALTGNGVTQLGSIAVLDLYYNTSGPWPQVGCTTTSPIAYALPMGTASLWLRLRNIMDGDTSSVISDTTLMACALAVSDATDPDAPVFMRIGERIVWEPERFPPGAEIVVCSPLGASVRTVDARAGSIALFEWSQSPYIVYCPQVPPIRAYRFIPSRY